MNFRTKTLLACILAEVIMITTTACGTGQEAGSGKAGQTTVSRAASSQTAASQSTVSQSTASAAVTAGSETQTGSTTAADNLKITESELAMIREKAEKLPDIEGLVLVKDLDDSISIDLKYATADNFTNKKVYPLAVCALQRETAIKLCAANLALKEKGLRLKVWDAYRPLYVQQIFWDLVKDNRFVADPATGGSIHNRGCAVDVTLVDEKGNELKMPTGFDDFSEKAYGDSADLSDKVKENLKILRTAMGKAGFFIIDTEWWHFEDEDQGKFEVSDVKLEEFK